MKAESMNLWKELSAIDVSEHVEKKGPLSYLSWAWAWSTLMDIRPEAEYEFKDWDGSPAFFYPDGSASVECTVNVGEISRTMWLPVMDHRSNVVANPDAKTISNARMRCLTKAISMLGLGHYLYAGEDTPDTQQPEKDPETQEPADKDEKQQANGRDFAVDGVVNAYREFLKDAQTKKELVAFWKKNKEELEKLEKGFPATYESVLSCFKDRQNEISQGE